ncbi:hypothetical protein FISHEDRAFT_68641 [Fistulina hepatica ATCC 64428]|uniref:DRBM domain-containing protein n=1 Tax=Fistulina hepatica ATCC 64428 TaxID=1128425 RepID=A0A0D7AQW3_9AGAR|nr:hypothetical protein FISHEDRAFT_68641 [Fistulina hepatica ATCC 64428]
MAYTLPPRPELGDSDMLLDVFSHSSVKFALAPADDFKGSWGNAERLTEIGGKVLELVVTAHWFQHQPMLEVQDLKVKVQETMEDQVMEWINQYKWAQIIRVDPNERDKAVQPESLRRFFYAFVGGLYVNRGLVAVQSWISALIDPDSVTPAQPSFPAPSMPPPPLPSGVPTNSTVSLAMFNQTAAQKGMSVTYSATQIAGEAHNPQWSVTCTVNGVARGVGTGKNQKTAKDLAAKNAWVALGW